MRICYRMTSLSTGLHSSSYLLSIPSLTQLVRVCFCFDLESDSALYAFEQPSSRKGLNVTCLCYVFTTDWPLVFFLSSLLLFFIFSSLWLGVCVCVWMCECAFFSSFKTAWVYYWCCKFDYYYWHSERSSLCICCANLCPASNVTLIAWTAGFIHISTPLYAFKGVESHNKQYLYKIITLW